MIETNLTETEPLKDDRPTVKPKTLLDKLRYFKENITVEPTLFCYVVPGVLGRLATQNLNLDKACRVNLGYGDVVCDALIAKNGDEYKTEEVAVQKLIASIETWKNFNYTAIPCMLIMFIGGWSDKTGRRKICILLPIFGELLMNISNIFNVYYFYEIPVQVTMMLEALFPAITGGYVTTFLGIYSYISDISSEESRTFRIGVVTLCLTCGNPVGSALSGILLELVGYYGVFGICSALYIFSIAYGFFQIKDPKRDIVKEKQNKDKHRNLYGSLKAFFDIKHVRDTFLVTFKPGPNKRRLKLVLVFLAIGFIFGPSYGEWTMKYLFTRHRFDWDALMYSYYNTFYVSIHILGALLMITILNRRLKWDDAALGIISNVSKIIGCIATGLARNTTEMYMAAFIEMFNATSYTSLRSISSKVVSSEELGKTVAMFNLMEVLASMIFIPLYSWIYMITLDVHSGMIFFISSLLTIPAIIIFGWFYFVNKKEVRTENEQTKSNNTVDEANKLKCESEKNQNNILLNTIITSN